MMPNKSQTLQQTGPARPARPAGPARPAMPPKKIYSREFKLEALRLLKSSGKTKTELERELGLYQGQLHLWEKAFNKAFNKEGGNLQQAFPGIRAAKPRVTRAIQKPS